MYRAFKMGIGMVVIAARDQVGSLQASIHEKSWIIDEDTENSGVKLVWSHPANCANFGEQT